MTASPQDELPPLPRGGYFQFGINRELYDAEAMQSFARAARAPLLAERTTLVNAAVNAAVNATERAEKAEAERDGYRDSWLYATDLHGKEILRRKCAEARLADAEAMLKEAYPWLASDPEHHPQSLRELLERIEAFRKEKKCTSE